MNRVPMADHHRGPEDEPLRYRSDRGQHQQPFDMRVVVPFDAMGREDKMVPNPDGVKAVGFGFARAFETVLDRCVRAEMRQQQTELQPGGHGHFLSMASWCFASPGAKNVEARRFPFIGW